MWESVSGGSHTVAVDVRHLKLMSDYWADCPLWADGQMVSPQELGLSASLGSQLLAWERHFDEHFDHEAGWDSPAQAQWYIDHVPGLVEALRQELAADVDIEVNLWPVKDATEA